MTFTSLSHQLHQLILRVMGAPVTLAVAALGSISMAILIGWLGDTLYATSVAGTNGCIAHYLDASRCNSVSAWRLLALPAAMALIGWGTWRTLARKLPPEVQKMRPVSPRSALLVLVSPTSARWQLSQAEQQWMVRHGETVFPLPASINGCIARLDASGSDWAWHNLLRAIAPHVGQLQHLVLITTADQNMQPGSGRDFPLLRQWLAPMLGQCQISELQCKDLEINDNAELIRRGISSLRHSYQLSEHDIIIDITGALKPLTIAATLATLDNDVSFQYVLSVPNQPGAAKVLECYSSVATQQQ